MALAMASKMQPGRQSFTCPAAVGTLVDQVPGSVRVVQLREAIACLRASTDSAVAAEEAKRRRRRQKKLVDEEAAEKQEAFVADPQESQGDVGAIVCGEEEEEEGRGHVFQYPGGASEATVLQYESSKDVADGLADYVARLSDEAVSAGRDFSIVLSGGSLVQALDSLTKEPYATSINWRHWHVFWVDERVVPLDHADSNYKLARDQFFSKVPIPEEQVHAIRESGDVAAVAKEYENRLRDMVKRKVVRTDDARLYPRFDLILLGIGPDGHIASLFPNSAVTAEKKCWVAPVTNSPKPPPNRITLTLPCINAAQHVAFVVLGRSKAFTLQRVLERPALPGSIPAQMVRLPDGELLWFVDQEAASSLATEHWNEPKTFPYVDFSCPKERS